MDTFQKKCTVEYDNNYGRLVRTGVDIKSGDTILLESPLVIIPSGNEKRCSNCLKRTNKFCSLCQIFPLCESCKQHNQYDCQLFAQLKNVRTDLLQEHHEIYGLLKCLLLCENPETTRHYDQLLELKSYQEEQRNSERWLDNQKRIIEPLLNSGLIKQLKLSDNANEELLQKICCIIDVNCFEVRGPDDSPLRGLYPRAALLTHSCVANTVIAIDDQYQMKIFANRDIQKEEMLSVCYINPLLGTDERRDILKLGKYLYCNCERCDDPTELGSHMSSFCCSSCIGAGRREGYHVKERGDSQWRCQICGHNMSANVADGILARVKEEIFFAKRDNRNYDLLIAKLNNIFHRNHYLIIDLKQNLAAILRAIIINSACRPGRRIYERKVRLCEDIVEVLRIVQPGISRYKAVAIYELYTSFAELIRLRFNENELNEMEFLELLQRAEQLLRESLQMLLYEPLNTPEGELARSMLKDLKDLQNDMKIIKNQKILKDIS